MIEQPQPLTSLEERRLTELLKQRTLETDERVELSRLLRKDGAWQRRQPDKRAQWNR